MSSLTQLAEGPIAIYLLPKLRFAVAMRGETALLRGRLRAGFFSGVAVLMLSVFFLVTSG